MWVSDMMVIYIYFLSGIVRASCMECVIQTPKKEKERGGIDKTALLDGCTIFFTVILQELAMKIARNIIAEVQNCMSEES